MNELEQNTKAIRVPQDVYDEITANQQEGESQADATQRYFEEKRAETELHDNTQPPENQTTLKSFVQTAAEAAQQLKDECMDEDVCIKMGAKLAQIGMVEMNKASMAQQQQEHAAALKREELELRQEIDIRKAEQKEKDREHAKWMAAYKTGDVTREELLTYALDGTLPNEKPTPPQPEEE